MDRIDSPTAQLWIVGRIQTNSDDDYPFVHSLQDRLELTPLKAWTLDHSPCPDLPLELPAGISIAGSDQVSKMSAEVFWTRFAELLKSNPPAPDDAPVVLRLSASGVVPGQSLDWARLSSEQQSLLTKANVEGCGEVEVLGRHPPFETRNTWTIAFDPGTYGANYPLRAAAARLGLGANLPRDVIEPIGRVDHQGNQLSGKYAYVMHFDEDELPPVHAFWSLTMYNELGHFASNGLGRFAIGDRDPLVYDDDGSLNLYIQYERPGLERGANWLPAPSGAFSLILRLYWPDQSILDGNWVPPRVTRVG
jgi:hypothetical protein